MIRKFKTGGKTIILTTHYLEEAESLSDRLAIMDRGRIIAIGTSDDIIGSFGSGERLDVRGGEELAKYLKDRTTLNVNYNATGLISISLDQKHDAYIALATMKESGLPWKDSK